MRRIPAINQPLYRLRLPPHRLAIETLHDDICDKIAALQDATERILLDAIERGGLDLSQCKNCSKLVVCIPDGISNICVDCEKTINKEYV